VRYRQQALNEQFDPDIHTGEYGGANIPAAFAWAAAELYITTGDETYYNAINVQQTDIAIPAWGDARGLLWMSLAHHRAHLGNVADQALIAARIESLADTLLARWQVSAWRVAMNHANDFYWGSNSLALNQAMMLIQGYRVNGNQDYLNEAQSMLEYVLGRNATGYSFVTGFGHKPPMYPHHRPSYADGIADPVPGFVVGGPHNRVQTDCGASYYPSSLPAKSYVDDWCSYATNEVAINWNAPLVYVTGALQVLLSQ
jgi:endoglucanase